jgi:hypothetical protein
MGGNRFFTRESGYSMQEAYKKAYDNAEREHGHQQGYSGEINSTAGFRDLTKEFKATKFTEVNNFERKLDDENKITKGNAYGVCTREPILNTNKIKSVVDNKPFKGTRQWKLQYAVYDYDMHIGSKDFKDEAIKLARQHTEKTKRKTKIEVERVSVQNSTVAEVLYKGATGEAPGQYVFFGIASC